jgi:multicomponent Na+:H+ antiporter subunit C
MIEYLMAIGVGVLFATGLYMMLRSNLVRILIGVILISNSVNLLVLTMGRLKRNAPPLIPEHEIQHFEPLSVANPLPQALILTAIVIGFGLLAFSLVLSVRAYNHYGTLNLDHMRTAEPPYPDEETDEEQQREEKAHE